jgi:hypothetical protein
MGNGVMGAWTFVFILTIHYSLFPKSQTIDRESASILPNWGVIDRVSQFLRQLVLDGIGKATIVHTLPLPTPNSQLPTLAEIVLGFTPLTTSLNEFSSN